MRRLEQRPHYEVIAGRSMSNGQDDRQTNSMMLRHHSWGLVAILFAIGCSSTSDGPTIGSAHDGGTSGTDSGSETAAGGVDGQSCTMHGTNCDPDCEASCGTDPKCVDLCCHETSAPGVFCGGTCVKIGILACGGKCVDGATDSKNCGACGKACTAPSVCAAGTCKDTP